jgi:hypothetical protein
MDYVKQMTYYTEAFAASAPPEFIEYGIEKRKGIMLSLN